MTKMKAMQLENEERELELQARRLAIRGGGTPAAEQPVEAEA